MKSQQWSPDCGLSWREEDAGIHPGERPPPRPAGRFLGFKFRRRWSELEQTFSGTGTRGRYDVTAAEEAAAQPRIARVDSTEPTPLSGLPLLCSDLLAGGCARRLLRGFTPSPSAEIPIAPPTSTLASEDSGGCRLTAVPVRKRYADIKAAAAADATTRPRPRGRYTKLSEGYRNRVTASASISEEDPQQIQIDVNMNYVSKDCTRYLTPTKSVEDDPPQVPTESTSFASLPEQDDSGTYGRTVTLRCRRSSLPLRAGFMTATEFLERRTPSQNGAPASPASQRSAPFLSTFSSSPEGAPSGTPSAVPSPVPPFRRASLPARPLSETAPKNLALIQRMNPGDLVWFDPGVGHVLPGEVMEYHRAAQVLTVQALIAGTPQTFTLTNLTGVRRRQDLGQNGVEDMTQLSDLNEASLLWNLKIRYDKELIYTYTGSILVAVNPYRMYDIFGLDMVKKYESQILGTLPPHLFAIGSSAYAQLSKEGEKQNQVVVISGESGSGKTESTKLVMQYLAAVNKSPSNLITEQILEASPLLESFGNAKTVRNDNSSRFGKYLEVHFKDGVIIGAKVTEYLLEKSRIVTQAPEERNYHVFYEMLTGLSSEQKQKYGLLTPEKYFYLNQGGSCEIDGKFDSDDFNSLLSAMQVLGFSMDEQDTIFKILASVLHLGNVYFHRKQLKHGTEGVEIGSDAEIRWTGHLLQLNVDGIKRSLTTKTTEARNERLLTPLSIDQALDARDAFAKALYNALFGWLVQRINSIVFKGTKRTASISILDIFGFEDFKENSFEQLCINYANENLQFYFNKHIFKLEQQEYAREKIDWQTISYNDNLPVINLIAKKPVGILHLLDDESNFPKATDVSFLEKCHYNHALDELYSRPRMSSTEFGIRHYAGQVWYSVDGFLDKNRDTLRQDVVELLISSKNTMLSRMFQNFQSNHEASKTINRANGRFVTMKPRTPTIAARFHDSLQQLLESMSKCNPWFVRCIKPNNDKSPMKLDMPIVLEQLRYLGMLETIRIRKMGYPVRLKFAHFVERYRYLLSPRGAGLPRGAPFRELCRAILDQSTVPGRSGDYQLGTTRVFMRENLERHLEKERSNILRSAAVTLQKHVRGFLARRSYQTTKASTIKLQAAVRRWYARKKYLTVKTGITRAQAIFRAKRQRKRYLQLKEELKRRAEAEKAARERAKAKAQREEQEKTSRAIAGVSHLEIPAELAFIFSKLEEWQPIHSERNLIKVVGGVPPRPDRYYLPQDIDYHAFTKFTNVYFKSHIWGMKREPIKTPFLAKSKDVDYQDSLAIFKLILRFMNDNNLNGKKEMALGDYIVNKGIINEKLRDEILCQLCNQTWKNDTDVNNERGWFLLANCLSCFPPSQTLHKFLLKYVSDHGYNGYKGLCQRKLLQASRVEKQPARTYPPSLLEWRANRKRVNMALPIHFADGEQCMTPVDSWTTSEELASLVIRDRGISECTGWSVSLSASGAGDPAGGPRTLEPGVTESSGHDYVFDLITELELAPSFPACRSSFLVSPDKPKRTSSSKIVSTASGPVSVQVEEQPLPSPTRRPAVPPPEPPIAKQPDVRKISRELIIENNKARKSYPANGPNRVRSQSRDHTVEIGLSRKSALNDRYFEDKPGRSRSLDNLLESEMPSPRKLKILGLSQSRLNDRYHSMEKMPAVLLGTPNGRGPGTGPSIGGVGSGPNESLRLSSVSNKEYMTKVEALLEDTMESVSQQGEPPRKFSISSNSRVNEMNHSQSGLDDIRMSSDILISNGTRQEIDFDYHDIASQACRSEDDKGSSIRGHPRFIKSHYAGKRAAPGSHSSRAYIEGRNSEKSEYGAKSSALSDTSEAPSLASHVRRVRVPSQASDVDQFLDDLFMPVLDGNLDELSDARSLAASIKGGGDGTQSPSDDDEVATLTGSATSTLRKVQNVDDYISDLFQPIFVNDSLKRLTKVDTLAEAIKGGGQGLGSIETRQTATQSQNPTAFGFTPISNVTSPPPLMPGLVTGVMSPPPLMMAGMTSLPLFGAQGVPGGVPGNVQLSGSPTTNGQQPSSLLSDPAIVAYQQSLQRAFLQSAMAQNIQIQQQLVAQNQALQTLLQTQATAAASNANSQQTPSSDHSDVWINKNSASAPTTPLTGPSTPVNPMQSKSSRSTPNQPAHTSVTRAQVHRSHSPSHRKSSLPPSNPHTAFTSVLSELRSRKSSLESNQSNSKGGVAVPPPPPPPPPMPPPPEHVDPSETRPFLDPYGRAKTVRIGKWRWPPPQSDASEAVDSFLHFKMRQHQRKVSPHKSSHDFSENGEGIEWEEFDIESSQASLEPNGAVGTAVLAQRSSSTSNLSSKLREFTPKDKNGGIVRSTIDLHSASTPSSVGKLRISSEMRSKLELVTASHSLRSTTKSEKPTIAQMSGLAPPQNQRTVSKLEDNRKLLLEQQLAGRWGSVDSVDAVTRIVSKEERSQVQITNIVRSQIERMEKPIPNVIHSNNTSVAGWKPAPPPPPVTPHYNVDSPVNHNMHHSHAPPSRTSSFYSQSNTNGVPQPKSPPPPIEPIRQRDSPRELFSRTSPGDRGSDIGPLDHRRASVSTHHTDNMERIEIEESSEFLQPVDSNLPLMLDRREDRSIESIKTKLCPPSSAAYFTYNCVAWKLNIKKEVFSPNETLSSPLALHLVFCQVVHNALSPNCIRINRDERTAMRKMLDSYGVTLNNLQSGHHKTSIKKNIIETAKNWQTYFARIFSVSGGHQNPQVQYLAISHSGVRLARKEKSAPHDQLQILDSFGFDEITEASMPKSSTLQIVLNTGSRILLYSNRANQALAMLQRYILESFNEGHGFVRGLTEHMSRDDTLLSFRKGDVIKLLNNDQYIQKGWMFGSLHGRSGVFPGEFVEPLARHYHQNQMKGGDLRLESYQPQNRNGVVDGWTGRVSNAVHPPAPAPAPAPLPPHSTFHPPPSATAAGSGPPSAPTSTPGAHVQPPMSQPQSLDGAVNSESWTQVNDGKHSLLQFAMHHFRQSPEKFEMLKTADGSISGSLDVIESLKTKKNKGKGKANKENEWTWKEQVELVKFSTRPIEQSLLRLETDEMNELAVECFVCIMRYMGDMPMTTDITEVKCVYTVLMHCHKHEPLRDEVYCQLMKQTTNNKSTQPESCQRGWRLFSIVAAYFVCSDTLKPYLFKYLETAAYDKRRAYHGTAMVCLQNLRKTFRYGGRKNVPSVEEITAISAGRNSKRQMYRLPGGTERVVNTRSTTVVQDVIDEICGLINVVSSPEVDEFSLYCIVEGDTFTMPLAREEYILDVTTELQKNQQVFYLIFCRSVWHFPLRLDSQLYIEVVFNQIAPDYLEGLLLVMPGETLQQDTIYEIAKIAALLHRAADMTHVPAMKETKFLLPKPALTVRDIKPTQWVNMVQSNWVDVQSLDTIQAKAQVLDMLSNWHLFGSSFFAVKRVSDPKERADHILALNRHGVHFIDVVTHETLLQHPFSEVISTRKVKSEDGTLFLDMKCGNLMQQRITRLQTDQAHEISRLIRQYITLQQMMRS